MLEISLLGSPSICLDGVRIPRVERHPKKLALLAYLCSQRPGRTTSRDTLLALFWPESTTSRARHGLSQTLHFLKRELGDVVVLSGAPRLAIDDSICAIDMLQFDRAIAEQRWSEASALYQGEVLEGVFIAESQPAQDWLENARASYGCRAAAAMWNAARDATKHGSASSVVEHATRAIQLDPLQEQKCAGIVDGLVQKSQLGSALTIIAELERAVEQATGESLSTDWSTTRERIAEALTNESAPLRVEVRRIDQVLRSADPIDFTTGRKVWRKGMRALTMTAVALACLALGKLVVTQSAQADGVTDSVLEVQPLTTTGDSGLARSTLTALVHALRDSAGLTVMVPERDQSPASGASYRLEAGLSPTAGRFALSYQLRHVKTGLVLGSGRTAGTRDPADGAVELALRVSDDIDQFKRLAPLRSADPEAVAHWNSAVALELIADSLRSAGAFGEAMEQYAIADSVYLAASRSKPLHLMAGLARVRVADSRAIAAATLNAAPWAANLWFRAGIDLASSLDDQHRHQMEVFQERGLLEYHRWIFTPISRDSARRMLDRAEADFRSAIRLDPSQAVTLNALSGVLFAKGDYAASLVYARQAWEKRSNRLDSHELLSRLFLAAFNAYDDRSASDWCEQLRVRYPGEWPGATCQLMLMAWSSTAATDTDLAWDLVNNGLSREPQHVRTALEPRLMLLMAAVLARAGKAYDGLATVKSVDESRDVELLGLKAAALLALADTAGARRAAQEYSNSHPVTADKITSARIYKGLGHE